MQEDDQLPLTREQLYKMLEAVEKRGMLTGYSLGLKHWHLMQTISGTVTLNDGVVLHSDASKKAQALIKETMQKIVDAPLKETEG